MNPDDLSQTVNLVGLGVAIIFLVIGLRTITRRIILYGRAEMTVPVLVRRDFGLLLGLSVLGVQSFLVHGLLTLFDIREITGWPRFFYNLETMLLLLVPLVYWVLVELKYIDNAEVK